MQHIRILVFLGLISMITACGRDAGSQTENQPDQTEEPEESWRELEREVIDIHDEVMPRMSELNNYIRKLKTYAADSTHSSETRMEAKAITADLVEADSLMWDWMHNYKRPENVPGEEVRSYLESERIKVIRVREAMTGSLERAETFMNEAQDNAQ